MKAVLYGAVRVNTLGEEFAAVDEYSEVRDLVAPLIGNTAAEMPEWHKANPVARIARFNVREALPRKPRRATVSAPAAPLVLITGLTARATEMIHFKRSCCKERNGIEYALIRVRDRLPLGKIYRDDAGRWVADVNGAQTRHATLVAARARAFGDANREKPNRSAK